MIKDGRIEKIGDEKSGESIDCKGKVVIPGIIDAHTHLYSFVKEKEKGMDYFSEFEIWNSSRDHIEAAVLEMLRNGITGFIDMGTDPQIIKEVAEKYKVRAYGGYFLTQHREIGDSQFFKQIINIYLPKDSDVISELTFNKPIHIKLPFTRRQVYDFKKRYNLMPIEFLNKFNLLNKYTYISNISWITNWEIEILKKNKPLITLTSTFDLKNSIGGFPPIKEILERNVLIGIGSDGIFGNESSNLLEEGKITILFYRSLYWDISLSYTDVFKMLTYNSYKALGINGGLVREGYVADLVVLDKLNIFSDDLNTAIRTLFNNFCKDHVEMTIVAGNLSYIREDYEKIRSK